MTFRAVDGTLHVRKSTSAGGTDVDIQAAYDHAVSSNGKIRTVEIPPGEWLLGDTIKLTPPGSTSLTVLPALVSRGRPMATTDLTRFANLKAQFDDRPIMQVSLGRSLHIEGLVLWGLNNIANNFSPFPQGLDNLLLDNVWLASGVETAHAGLAIDNDIPSPGLGGTALGLIRNCVFRDVARGITNGSHTNAQNGSEINVDGCLFDFCGEAAYAPGHGQTKDWAFSGCWFNGCKYLVNGRLVGALAGFSPHIYGGGVTLCQRLFEINNGNLFCSLNNVESTYGIGTIGATFSLTTSPAEFRGTTFAFMYPQSATGGNIDAHLYGFHQSIFSACTFLHTTPSNPATFRIHNPGAAVLFDACQFRQTAESSRLPIDAHDPTRVKFRGCLGNTGAARLDIEGAGSHSDLSLGSCTMSRVSEGIAEVTGAGVGAADVGAGDLVARTNTWTPKNPTEPTNPSILSLGEVVSKVSNTLTVHGVPETIDNLLPITEGFFRRRFVVA